MSALVFLSTLALNLYAIDEDRAAKEIDQLIEKKLKEMNLDLNSKISDETFLRRAYLDIIGRIPTVKEYETFMRTPSTTRRAKLIDQLFESKGYVSHSFNYWADVLRVTDFLKKSTGEPYKHWIKKSLESNQPYDEFVHDLLSSEGPLFKPDNGAVGYYLRDFGMPLDNVANTMQVFLGTSMVCAQCHDHPSKKWTQMDFYKLAAFTHGTFLNVKELDRSFEEDVKRLGLDTSKGKAKTRGFNKEMRPLYQGAYNSGTGKIKLPSDYEYDDAKPNQLIRAGVPYGPDVSIDYSSDNGAQKRVFKFGKESKKKSEKITNVNSRKFMADWVISPENPMFTKTIVNRLWERMMGRPLVGNPTDIKETSFGTNPELTEFLIDLMKKIKYDQKKFMNVLARTRTYQSEASQNVTGKYYFPGPVKKRLSAEQLWDSLLSLRADNPDRTAVVPELSKENHVYLAVNKMSLKEKIAYAKNPKPLKRQIDKKYGGVVVKRRSTDARASEMMSPSKLGTTLQGFGQSRRQTIDGSNTEATIPQALSLLNEDEMSDLKSNTYLTGLLKKESKLTDKTKLLYQAVLTREPNRDERMLLSKTARAHSPNELTGDLFWALVNSQEFRMSP